MPLMHTPSPSPLPNIVFLVVESTDGRTWTPGYSNSALVLPAIRSLQQRGVSFERHYSNAPVCCPSRASFWSGRHVHKIAHDHSGVKVRGAWNNFEGLPQGYPDRIDQVLGRNGYATKISGKKDWDTGSHSMNVRLSAWTMYTRFAYNVNRSGGWNGEPWFGSHDGCSDNGTVLAGAHSAHEDDWKNLNEKEQHFIKMIHGRRMWFRPDPCNWSLIPCLCPFQHHVPSIFQQVWVHCLLPNLHHFGQNIFS